MVGIIPTSHGDFARSILQSEEVISGAQSNVKTATLQPSEGPDDIRAKMEEVTTTLEDPEQVLLTVDLWGDTPFNQTSGLINGHKDTWTVVTGLNLPMLAETSASRMSTESVQEIVAHVYGVTREEARLLPETLEPTQEKQAAEPMTPQGAIPEETVIGDGHIKCVLARIDSRLSHGQVTTAWMKTVKPAHITMVFDGVVKDELRRSLIEQAAPPGVKANVVLVDKTIQVAKDLCLGSTKAILLFETSQDALRIIEGDMDAKELNIGSMVHSVGKIAVGKALFLGKDDVKTFEELKVKGVQFDMRKAPNDSKENADDIIRKAKVKLA